MRRILLLLLAIAAAAPAAQIAPGVTLLPGAFVRGAQPDGNTVIWSAPHGLVVLDSGRHAPHAQAIVDFASAAQAPVKAVINSHWHLDHVSGNAGLRRAFPGLRVLASDTLAAARAGFLARYREDLEAAIAAGKDESARQAWRDEIARIDSWRMLVPDEVIDRGGTRTLAGRSLYLGLARAATAGDVWVLDPAAGVLAAGDLVTLPVPFLDTACPWRWRETLESLGRLDFTLVVPGHGAPLDRAGFDAWRGAFNGLLACAATTQAAAACADGWALAAAPLLAADEPGFVHELAEYYVTHSLRADAARVRALCDG